MFKYKDKQQLRTLYIQCHSTNQSWNGHHNLKCHCFSKQEKLSTMQVGKFELQDLPGPYTLISKTFQVLENSEKNSMTF